MDEYESVLLVKQEVFVYRIPPRTTNRGYRAADWDLGTPDWTGRMRLVSRGKDCIMKLEDKISGQMFAKCVVDKYPGLAIEAVTDSSRYFVVRILDEQGRSAFIGLGFGDRSDSFDLNVALQDHFKWIKVEAEAEKPDAAPSLDLGFKEGQTIKINMKITKKEGQDGEAKSRPKPKTEGGGLGLLPPPPGGIKLAPPPSAPPAAAEPSTQGTGDSWGDFVGSSEADTSDAASKSASGAPAANWSLFRAARPKILSMRYGAAYLLAALSGSSPSAKDLEKILGSVGIDCDAAQAKLVVNALSGKNVEEVIAEGMEKIGGLLCSGGGGGAVAAAGPSDGAGAAAEAPKAEEKAAEPEEESDDDMGFGLFD
ncbi:Ribosomal protein L12 family [Trinorchestia longiramus]|nr:Ribosomal protein L12 family [Trinorchestia longiramus]